MQAARIRSRQLQHKSYVFFGIDITANVNSTNVLEKDTPVMRGKNAMQFAGIVEVECDVTVQRAEAFSSPPKRLVRHLAD